jgi:hypothetical protein
MAKLVDDAPEWWAATLQAASVEQVESNPLVALERLRSALSK